jgi:hypothetical protein
MESSATTTTTTTAPRPQFTGCCPPFDPKPWQDAEIHWHDKPFLKEHVRAVFHIPYGMGRVVTRAMTRIEAARAQPEHPLMLNDDVSLWGSDLYIEVAREVPRAEMVRLSGTFLTKVFEGPYSQAPRWMSEMKRYVEARGRKATKLYLGFTTCPACAKAYGKNYVIVFAKIEE